MDQINTNLTLNKLFTTILILGLLFFNRPMQAQLVCGVENPAAELEWLSALASNPIQSSNFLPVISAFELDGETYISVNPKIPDGGTMIFNCSGDFLCYQGGLVYPPPVCFSGGTPLGTFGIPGKSEDFPIVYSICAGETINLTMYELGAPPPPTIFQGDVGVLDFSNVDYFITSLYTNNLNEETCGNCTSLQVNPETTTMYKAWWQNSLPSNPSNQFSGEGYFLVEVETCSTIVNVTPSSDYKPIEFMEEGVMPIWSYWVNEGPGFLTTAEFEWVVNGEVIETTTFNGEVSVDERFRMDFENDYIFRADTEYTISVRLLTANGTADTNASDNLQIYTPAPFSAEVDMSLDEFRYPTLPVKDELSSVVVEVINHSNVIIDDYTIQWTLNGELQTPYKPDSPANFKPRRKESIVLTKDYINYNSNSDYKIVAWIELPDDAAETSIENNSVEFLYAAKDKAFYEAENFMVICEGESASLPSYGFHESFVNGCGHCEAVWIDPIWSVDGTVINIDADFDVTPEESTMYNAESNSIGVNCNYWTCGPSGTIPPEPDYPDVMTNANFAVIVLDCDFEPTPLNIIDDYVWLNDVIDKNNCNGTTIKAYENGAFDFVYVQTNESGTLYLENGTPYCNDYSDNPYCVNAYGLSKVTDSYTCGSSPEPVEGCTDLQATNYNPSATVDDGSCEFENTDPTIFITYPWLSNYIDPNNCNGEKVIVYNASYNNFILIRDKNGGKVYWDNGSYFCDEIFNNFCLTPFDMVGIEQIWTCGTSTSEIEGCTDPTACYFDSEATIWDGSCTYSIQWSRCGYCGAIPGCTDPDALNYNPEANCFNGCTYTESIVATPYTTSACIGDQITLRIGARCLFDDPHITFENIFPENIGNLNVNLTEFGLLTINVVKGPNEIIIKQYPGNDSTCGSEDIRIKINISDDCSEENVSVFSTYPWLSTCVDQNNCNGQNITVYNDGFYNFILVQNGNEGKLFFENGIFYCNETPTYSCVAAYGLDLVTETWTCGDDTSINGCTDIDATNYDPRATIDDGTCQYENTNSEVFSSYPWLKIHINPENCNGETITVYDADSYSFILIQNGNEGKLYFENGTFYCNETPTYSCVSAYGLNNISNTWTCGNNPTISGCTDVNATNYNASATIDDGTCEYENSDCTKYMGTFFYQDCGGTNYYFIRLDDGRVFDPYFADGIGFTPREGQQITFDYVINTEVVTPCAVSESPITIVCYEEISGTIFEDYSWLNSKVNENNCSNENITVYDADSYNFVYIQTANSSSLYFQDGTFYCQDVPGYSCLSAYSLSNAVNTWNCGIGGIEADRFYAVCPEESVILDLYNIPSRTCSCGELDSGLIIPSFTIYANDELIANNISAIENYVLEPIANTIYTIIGKSGAPPIGCECEYIATTIIQVDVNEDCGGNQKYLISDSLRKNENFHIYPNPTTDKVFIEWSDRSNYQISLMDISGKVIKQTETKPQATTAELNVSEFPKGMYLVKLKNEQNSIIKKLIIE